MCYKLIEKPSCGHTTTHTIPCEGILTHDKCDAPPEACQDKTNALDEACRNCKADEEEEAALAEALKQIAEDPALAAEPKRGVQDGEGGNGEFGFFKGRVRWSFCGHYDSPQELSIERFSASDPIWLDTEEPGSCHNCCKTPDSILKTMRANGDLDGEDPWGALKKPAMAAASGSGSSKPIAPAQSQAKNYGGDLGQHPALSPFEEEEEEYIPPTRHSSPDQIPTLSKKGKGKARPVDPDETYIPKFAPVEPDSEHEGPTHSGDEDEGRDFWNPKIKVSKYESDDEDGEEGRGRKTGHYQEDDSREGSRRARSSSSKYSQGDDDGRPDYDVPPPGGPPPPTKAARGKVLPAVDEEG